MFIYLCYVKESLVAGNKIIRTTLVQALRTEQSTTGTVSARSMVGQVTGDDGRAVVLAGGGAEDL